MCKETALLLKEGQQSCHVFTNICARSSLWANTAAMQVNSKYLPTPVSANGCIEA